MATHGRRAVSAHPNAAKCGCQCADYGARTGTSSATPAARNGKVGAFRSAADGNSARTPAISVDTGCAHWEGRCVSVSRHRPWRQNPGHFCRQCCACWDGRCVSVSRSRPWREIPGHICRHRLGTRGIPSRFDQAPTATAPETGPYLSTPAAHTGKVGAFRLVAAGHWGLPHAGQHCAVAASRSIARVRSSSRIWLALCSLRPSCSRNDSSAARSSSLSTPSRHALSDSRR